MTCTVTNLGFLQPHGIDMSYVMTCTVTNLGFLQPHGIDMSYFMTCTVTNSWAMILQCLCRVARGDLLSGALSGEQAIEKGSGNSRQANK